MSQQPGWYYAEGDPPGTQRYWDGELWQGDPQPAAAQPVAAQPGAASPGGYSGGYQTYPEKSQATTALVVSILGLVICGVLGPICWNLGQKELDGIAAGRRDPSNQGTAKAAKIIGIIVTALLVLAFVLILALVVFGRA